MHLYYIINHFLSSSSNAKYRYDNPHLVPYTNQLQIFKKKQVPDDIVYCQLQFTICMHTRNSITLVYMFILFLDKKVIITLDLSLLTQAYY